MIWRHSFGVLWRVQSPLSAFSNFKLFLCCRWQHTRAMGGRDGLNPSDLCEGLCVLHDDRVGQVLAHGLSQHRRCDKDGHRFIPRSCSCTFYGQVRTNIFSWTSMKTCSYTDIVGPHGVCTFARCNQCVAYHTKVPAKKKAEVLEIFLVGIWVWYVVHGVAAMIEKDRKLLTVEWCTINENHKMKKW